MSELPTGTVTFAFTDIEGSTRLVQDLGDRWPALLEQHYAIARAAIEGRDGVVVRTEGDAVFAAFGAANDALMAMVDLQRAMAAHPWPDDGVIRVRAGVHTGSGVLGGDDYVGLEVHRAARIAATPHGGQIVVSEATAAIVERDLPEGISLLDLGKHRLKDLTEREAIYQVVADDLERSFPPLNSLERIAHNLPVQVTSFVGREQEIEEAVQALEAAPVVTLLGPGGTGKTRLSLQVAAECADRFDDGAFFVPLASVADPELVPSAILGAVGVPASTRRLSPREHLVDFFATRSALLVLDNFEQILDAGNVVGELVRRSPGSRVLVTSRVPLRIAGEQEMPIRPLPTGGEGVTGVSDAIAIPAVHLFVDRAVAVRPDFELTDDNAPDVVELVNRLDGLPLAIELVVPQLRMLPVSAVLERLDPSRIGGSRRDAPERHQTLWNAISWSVSNLSDEVRDLFARLGVFSAGARIEEVEVVCGDLGIDVVEGIGTLIEHSLLLPGDTTDDVRFRWLRVIREFALELLDDSGDRAEAERLHATAYLALAEQASREILGTGRRRWVEAMDRDQDNLRSAVRWAIEHDETDMALRLAWAGWRFWQTRGHLHEARVTVERVLTLEGGDRALRAKALEALGGIAWWEGEMERADEIYADVLDRQREIGDRAEIANALYNVSLTRAYGFGDADATRALLAEARAIYEDLGDPGGLADVFWALGSLAYIGAADPDESEPFLERSVALYREAGNVFGEGWASFELAALRAEMGQPDAAERHLVDGLRLLWEARDYSAVVMFVAIFGWVADQRGDRERAVRLMGASYALRDQTGVDIMSIQVNQIDGLRIDELEALDGDLALAYAEGRAMGFDEAVRYALGEPDEFG